MASLNPQNEPVGVSTIVVILTWVSAHWLVSLDATTATAIATIVFVVAQWIARRFSTPVKRAQTLVDQAAANPPGAPVPKV